jgi:hypothetical protein
MAVGRNLACRKELILRAQQDPLWIKTASGDDDMLIRICARAGNMVVVGHPAAHTYSITKKTWGAYLLQKQRHSSTGKFYAAPIKRLLGAYALTHALFWISLLIYLTQLSVSGLAVNGPSVGAQIIGALVIIRLGCFHSAMTAHTAALTGSRRLNYFWLIFDICWMGYNIILSPYILWKSKQRWR